MIIQLMGVQLLSLGICETRVYAIKPETTPELKAMIQHINFVKVTENFMKRKMERAKAIYRIFYYVLNIN